MKWRDQNDLDVFLYGSVMQSMERLLHALMKLCEEDSECVWNFLSENILHDLSLSDNSVQNSFASDSNKSWIVDMELYVNEDSRDVDILTVERSGSSALYQSFRVFSQFYLLLHGISFLNSWGKNLIGRYIPHKFM